MKKNKHAQLLGQLGGQARAKALSPEQRLESSRHANLIKKKRRSLAQGLEAHEPKAS